MRLRIILIASILVVTAWNSSVVNGQAFCALRDPAKLIYHFYPDSTSYKSLVRTVDEGVRNHVSSKLPFSIHFNELGKHTLYIPVKGGKPLGVVHVRSESGNYGLTEIVWSLTPNMEVMDFEFQRCRSRSRTYVESAAFKQQIIGKRFRELRALLDDSGQALATDKLKVEAKSSEIVLSLIKSALKTISVTESAWKKDLGIVKPIFNAYDAFPAATRVQKVAQPYNANVVKEFDKLFPTSSGNVGSSVNRDNVMMIRASNADGVKAGHVVVVPWKSKDSELTLWWTVEKGEVKAVHAEDGWPTEAIRKAFEDVVGLKDDALAKCGTATKIVGAEVLLLAKHN